MKDTSWSKIKLESLKDLKEGACQRGMENGQPAFYIIVNPQGAMRDRVEGICGQIDASRGLS